MALQAQFSRNLSHAASTRRVAASPARRSAICTARRPSVAARAQDSETAPPVSAQPQSPAPSALQDEKPETVFYEGSGSNAELAVSLLLLPTLIFAPLSIASIGRRLWISFRFTDKRVSIINTSPLFARTLEVAYKNIKDVKTVPRLFGAWGDMVIFLRDGSRLELRGVEKYKEIEDHIKRCIFTM